MTTEKDCKTCYYKGSMSGQPCESKCDTNYSYYRPILFIEEITEKEQEILAFKKKEYSDGTDINRYKAFYDVGAVTNQKPEMVAMTYLMKHITGISQAIQNDEIKNWYWVDEKGNEGLKQRFADARNYLLLLGGMIDDMQTQQINTADMKEAK